jgi:hypothetical protein
MGHPFSLSAKETRKKIAKQKLTAAQVTIQHSTPSSYWAFTPPLISTNMPILDFLNDSVYSTGCLGSMGNGERISVMIDEGYVNAPSSDVKLLLRYG